MPRKTILIIEDDESSRRILTDVLNARGYNVTAGDMGAAAIELVYRQNPHLILLDIRLPDLSGLDIARRLKSSPATRHIPIIAVTAYAMRGDAGRALDSGCDAYVAKPFHLPDLLVLIAILLSRHPLSTESRPGTGILPAAGSMRWSARKKAVVVIAVRSGMISIREASRRYMVSDAELADWREALDRDGIPGLLAKNLRRRRTPPKLS
jgi:two-component system cell cycle response regulator DivK